MSELHPQVRALLAAADADLDEDGPPDLVAERAGYLETAVALGGAPEPVTAIEDLVIANGDTSVRARAYVPAPAPADPGALLWMHGGGWCVGDVEGFDRAARALANATRQVVVSVDYRLAPEHPFPAALEDVGAALAWMRDHGARQLDVDPRRVAVGGDSAGGNLAAVAALRARDDGLAPVRAQLLVYPALDATMSTEAYREFADGPWLTAASMRQCWTTYLDGIPREHPDASPLHRDDLAGAPRAVIAVAGHDPLRDDGLLYADALRAAGVAVDVAAFDDMVHGFLRYGGVLDRTRELLDWLGERVRAALGEAAPPASSVG